MKNLVLLTSAIAGILALSLVAGGERGVASAVRRAPGAPGQVVTAHGNQALGLQAGTAAFVTVESAQGSPGETVEFTVSLTTQGNDAVGLAVDIAFDPATPVDAGPACAVNPEIHKDNSSFVFRPQDCTPGTDCDSLRVSIFSLNPQQFYEPIPTGVVFTCSLTIPEDATIGTSIELDLSRAVALKADGEETDVTAASMGGQITVVQGPGCDGDVEIVRVGSEFQVNTYTRYFQRDATVTADADGHFVVAWVSYNDGDQTGVFLQRYDSAGDAIGGELQVNTFTGGGQYSPAVAASPVGDFVVAWTNQYRDGSVHGVFAQRYDSGGNAVGSEFQVNTYTKGPQDYPVVGVDADGNFVVAWNGVSSVFAQRYDSAGNALGIEFQVNTYTLDSQYSPAIATGEPGNFVVAWVSRYQDGDFEGIFAQRYDSAGNAVGGEFQVSTYTAGFQRSPAVAVDTSGGFVVAWEKVETGEHGFDSSVFAQRYDSAGNTVGVEFRVNSYTLGDQSAPAIVAGADGAFVVAWESGGQDGSGAGIFAQRYDSTGKAVDGEFQVNTYTEGGEESPAVASDEGGHFMVAWEGNDVFAHEVFAQLLAEVCAPTAGTATPTPTPSDTPILPPTTTPTRIATDTATVTPTAMVTGTLTPTATETPTLTPTPPLCREGVFRVGSEFQVNTHTEDNQQAVAVAADGDGDFVVAWQSRQRDGSFYTDVFAQRFASDGRAVGSEFQVNTYTEDSQFGPAVAADADGNFVATWTNAGQGGSYDEDVFAQRYASDGTPVGSEFQVNTHVNTHSEYNQAAAPVAADGDGDFVVAWESRQKDGTFYTDVFAQRFASDGSAVGSEFQVNTYTEFSQGEPAVAADNDGDFVVAWTRAGSDVFAQRFASDGSAVGSEFQVNTYTEFGQREPAVAADSDGDFVVAWTSQDGHRRGVFAQRYASDGNAVGTEFQVNTYTTFEQYLPAMAASGEGDFVVAWTSPLHDVGGGVFAQRYASDGSTVGTEFRVNTFTTRSQSFPAVAADSDGDFVVAWQDNGQDGSIRGIFAQRFAAVCPPTAGSATPTPTQTDTPTFSLTASPTPTATVTATRTLTPTVTATVTPTPRICPGDCNRDGEVSLDELVTSVRIALSALGIDVCPSLDRDDNGVITIDEPVAAVASSMNGCEPSGP